MKHRLRAQAITALLVAVLAACSSSPVAQRAATSPTPRQSSPKPARPRETSPPASPRHHPSKISSPKPKALPTTTVFEGASTWLQYPSKEDGYLSVRVDRKATPDGKVALRLELERVDQCRDDHCRSAWTRIFNIPIDSFTIDPDLKSASLSVYVMSRRLTAAWRGASGRVTRPIRPEGILLYDQREAFGKSSFGSLRGEWEKEPGSNLYRRTCAPGTGLEPGWGPCKRIN